MFPTTDREACLEALKAVLLGITGVKTVLRHNETDMELAAPQLPAIIITEDTGTYKKYNDFRKMQIDFNVELVLVAVSQRTSTAVHGNAGTVRELFTHAVINALSQNADLTIQLDGEEAEVAHCNQVGPNYAVDYDEEIDHPYVSSSIKFPIKLVTTMNDLPTEVWETWVAEYTPGGAPEDDDPSTRTDPDPKSLPDGGIVTVDVTTT